MLVLRYVHQPLGGLQLASLSSRQTIQLPQMSEGFCDSRINRAIIRLYALHPMEQKEDIVVNILALVRAKKWILIAKRMLYTLAAFRSVTQGVQPNTALQPTKRLTSTKDPFPVLQSLIALPEPDFLTTLCMIPQSLVSTEEQQPGVLCRPSFYAA